MCWLHELWHVDGAQIPMIKSHNTSHELPHVVEILIAVQKSEWLLLCLPLKTACWHSFSSIVDEEEDRQISGIVNISHTAQNKHVKEPELCRGQLYSVVSGTHSDGLDMVACSFLCTHVNALLMRLLGRLLRALSLLSFLVFVRDHRACSITLMAYSVGKAAPEPGETKTIISKRCDWLSSCGQLALFIGH